MTKMCTQEGGQPQVGCQNLSGVENASPQGGGAQAQNFRAQAKQDAFS